MEIPAKECSYGGADLWFFGGHGVPVYLPAALVPTYTEATCDPVH